MTWQAMSGDGTAGQAGVPRTLRILGLTAVCVLVAALAIATFFLSYHGIKAFALQAGIAPSHAKYYPLLLDATLVIVLAALLGLRGAGLPSRFLCWLTLLAVLGAAAAADAMHATKHKLPHQDAATIAAILPWALLFVAILLLLSLVRQARRRRRAEDRWRAWQASTVPLTLDPDLLTMPAPTAELPVQTAQPWQSPSIVPGFSPGPLPAAAAAPPAAPPAPPLSSAPDPSAAIPETAIPEPPAAIPEPPPAIPEPPPAIPEPSAGRGTLWGQDQQQSGDVLASGSGYSGSAKPAAEAPPDEIDTIQPETATQQPHPDQVAADLAGQQAEAADAADVEPDEAVEPSAAADQPTDGDEPIDTQQRRSGGAGRAAIAGLRNFRPWRGRGGVAADEATTTETDRIAAETGEPSAVADQPADAEERSETQEERSDLQRRRVTAGLRNIRLRRGSADVIAEEGDVPAEAEGAAEPGQPPAGPDEASNVQRRLGEAGRAAMAGLRNIRPRRGRGDVTHEEDDVPAEAEGAAEPGQPPAGPDQPSNVQRRLGEAGRAAMAGLRNIRPRRGRGDLPAEDEPTAETGLPPASATEQADQAQQESGDEDLEADPAGHQPDATEDPVADVADPPARQE